MPYRVPITRSTHWCRADIPDQTGRTVVITGANSGIGLETTRALLASGARVVMVCRSEAKANAAASQLRREQPTAELQVVVADLADLSSVARAAATIVAAHPTIDLLINNAGIMMVPYELTVDGYERQFATNHLGHFAFTGHLLDAVLAAPAGRIVTVSSLAHRSAVLDLENLLDDAGRSYQPQPAYRRSKLANLLFSYELDRRLRAGDHTAISVAAHPGLSSTNLLAHVDGSWWGRQGVRLASRLIQGAATGALPTLRAATDPDVAGGTYYGPSRRAETSGPPVVVGSSTQSHNAALASDLWTTSTELTGVSYSGLR
ncbi:MAG: oxidoreductase [Acidimicrobiales bacterium]